MYIPRGLAHSRRDICLSCHLMKRPLLFRKKSKRGQTLVEYALILAFIAVVAISVVQALGKQVTATFSRITTSLATQASH